MSGIGSGKDPNLFGDLLLVGPVTPEQTPTPVPTTTPEPTTAVTPTPAVENNAEDTVSIDL